MKTRILLGSTLALSLLSLIGCNKNNDPNNGVNPSDTTVAAGFTFATVNENTINLNVIDMQGAPAPRVKVTLYSENPIDPTTGVLLSNVDTLATGQTNSNGLISMMLNVNNNYNSLFAVVNLAGYINPKEIPLNKNGATNFTIAPAGYVSSKAATKSDVLGVLRTATNTQAVNIQRLRNNIYTMSGWDSQGVPAYHTTVPDAVSTSILNSVSNSLPERLWEPTAHPQFFTNPQSANINIIEDAQVWVTFVSEGAGYRSAMGYFTYPTGTPPTSAANISKMYILYPNCSFTGSGGNLNPGTKVQLVVSDGNGGYTDRIPAGTSIGWFLISDGFSGSSVGTGGGTVYSIKTFNPGNYQQTIVLNDPIHQLNFISFEDIPRTSSSCDGDYNDVIFYCTASPYTAIDQTDIPVVIVETDADGDGVKDVNDAYPNDPKLAYDSYYPAKNVFGTMAYEDLWPSTGDYDFNDLVVDFNFHQQLNAQNLVVNILPTIVLRAVGASYRNGFAIGLNTTKGNIKSVSGTRLTGSVFAIGANGAEIGNSNAVIPIFADGYALFGNKPYTNTYMNQPHMTPVTLNVVIQLITPTAQSALGFAPYDPFMVIAQNRSREVHLMNYNPTQMADLSLLGTGNDVSNPSMGKYYVTKTGKPWAIQFPVSLAYPIEKASISNAYPHFNAWAASGGTTYVDWFSNSATGYRNLGLIYNK